MRHGNTCGRRFSFMGFRFAAFLFSLVVLIALSCAKAPQSPVIVALAGNPSTLDPQVATETLTFQVNKSLYDTLLEPDGNGNLVPSLAESWTASDDNLSIDFVLRPGVRFHDGSEFDSSDVKASIDRIRDPATRSPGIKEFKLIQTVDTPGPLRVVIRLSVPDAPLLATLASGWSAMLPSEKIASGFDFAAEADGTGPFVLESWQKDSSIVLKKNPDYWQSGKPGLDSLVFKIEVDYAARLKALEENALDVVDMILPEDIPRLQKHDDIRLVQDLSSLVLVVAMNTSRGIPADKHFREAVAYAIDKRKVLDAAYGGGTIVGTFNDAGNPYYADLTGLYPFDPVRAKQSLAKSSYRGEVMDLVLPGNFDAHLRAGALYQEMLRNAGITTKIRVVDWNSWIRDVYGNAEYDLTVIGHTGKLDPDGRFQGYGRGGMYTRWVNPEAASLIDEARMTLNPERRGVLYRQVQRLFAEDLPFVYVGTPTRIWAYNKRIAGFVYTPDLDTYDLRNVRYVP